MKKSVIIFCFVISSVLSPAQNNDSGKKLIHAINIEALSAGYSIREEIKNKNYFGFGIQLGPSIMFFLNQPEFSEQYIDETDTTSDYIYKNRKLSFGSKNIELTQLKFYYSRQVSENFLYNGGLYFGIGYLPGTENEKIHFSFGALFEAFYGWKHLKIGTGIQIGDIYKAYNSEHKVNIFSVLLTPLKVKITF